MGFDKLSEKELNKNIDSILPQKSKAKQVLNLENISITYSRQSILDQILNRFSALIIRQRWGWSEMQMFLNQNDKVIASSLSLLNN